MKLITRGRISSFMLFPFIEVHFVSKGSQQGPINPVWIISTLDARHEVLRGSQAPNTISETFEGEEVDVPLVSRRQACNPSDLLIEVGVGHLSSGKLIGRRELNQVVWRAGGNYIEGLGPTQLAKWMVIL